jgi:Na+-transporting methylmalonyl-CoA/oxaloacetate decarboxylase gamma subunit
MLEAIARDVGATPLAMWIGLELTIYGMGLVFLLLAVLWGLIAWLVRLDQQAVAEPEPEPALVEAIDAPAGAAITAPAGAPALPPDVLAAVVIACRAHRMTRRKQAAPEMRTHEPGSLPSRWIGTGRTRQNRSWAPGGRYA